MDLSAVNTEVVLWVVDTLLIIVGTLIMWNIRRFSSDIKELQTSLTDVKVNYVHKDELRDIKDELGRRFDRLENLFLNGRRHEGQ